MDNTGKARILLLTSPSPQAHESPFSVVEKLMPLGIGYLIAVLKRNGHHVDFVDLYIKDQAIPDIRKYDFVGISVNTICFRGTLRIIHHCVSERNKGWKGKIIVGGPHTSVALETIPEEVDYIVQGEGERAIIQIVEENTSERIIASERIKDLDVLPRPAYDYFTNLPYDLKASLIPKATKVFSASSSRGCPFQCSFCSAKNIWKCRYTYFSADRVVDDIEYLIKEYGVDGIYFREDNFSVNKKRLVNICEQIIRKELPVQWATETRVDTIDKELLQLMHRAGCRGLYFGIEAATQSLLDQYQKQTTVQQIENALRWTSEIGIKSYSSFIIDTPQETIEDRKAVLSLIDRFKINYFALNHFTGIPGSELYDQVIREKSYTFIDEVGLAHMPVKRFPKTTFRMELRRIGRIARNPGKSMRKVIILLKSRL
jgi:O-antigen biosynthesis protein